MKKLLTVISLGFIFSGCSMNWGAAGTAPASKDNENAGVESNAPASGDVPVGELTRYRGSFFEIGIPKDFRASPALGNADHIVTDEALFTSPDGKVEFFVFAPKGTGETHYTDILPTEESLNDQTFDHGDHLEKVTTRVVFLAAKDGSYKRSFVINQSRKISNGFQYTSVVGIKYPDDAVYARYKTLFTFFENSLAQYVE